MSRLCLDPLPSDAGLLDLKWTLYWKSSTGQIFICYKRFYTSIIFYKKLTLTYLSMYTPRLSFKASWMSHIPTEGKK